MDNLLIKCRDSLESINKYSDAAKEQVKKLVMEDGVVSKGLMAREQHAAHSLAWIATYKATLTELLNWAERLESENKFLETEKLILQFAFSEYLSQLWHGIPMSQMEYARPQDLGLKKITKISKELGIYENPDELLSISLGSAETTLLKLTSAYCSFVNGGKLIEPKLIDRIQDSEGNTIYKTEVRKCKNCEDV